MAAEFAVAMPAVIVVCALAVGAVVAASAQTAAQDAAGEAARLAARGDDHTVALQIAGLGATASVRDSGELRCVNVTVPIRILGRDTGIQASAESCAIRDFDQSGGANG
ncbi:TadE family type IV pilus minor pilin [Gulosibacter bifidus]|uniref:TadE family type IV pilus minor pilin n=1 Tax=Gulosibacter bifidus TaxID=272239 RepID=A0ABW5RNE0_9MICO